MMYRRVISGVMLILQVAILCIGTLWSVEASNEISNPEIEKKKKLV